MTLFSNSANHSSTFGVKGRTSKNGGPWWQAAHPTVIDMMDFGFARWPDGSGYRFWGGFSSQEPSYLDIPENCFLIVSNDDESNDMTWQTMDGTLLTDWSSVNNKFLMSVYYDQGVQKRWGQYGNDQPFVGNSSETPDGYQWRSADPNITYDKKNDKILYMWEDDKNDNPVDYRQLRGRYINADGTISDPFNIGAANIGVVVPSLVFSDDYETVYLIGIDPDSPYDIIYKTCANDGNWNWGAAQSIMTIEWFNSTAATGPVSNFQIRSDVWDGDVSYWHMEFHKSPVHQDIIDVTMSSKDNSLPGWFYLDHFHCQIKISDLDGGVFDMNDIIIHSTDALLRDSTSGWDDDSLYKPAGRGYHSGGNYGIHLWYDGYVMQTNGNYNGVGYASGLLPGADAIWADCDKGAGSYHSAQEITLTAEAGSPVNAIKFRWDSGGWQTYNAGSKPTIKDGLFEWYAENTGATIKQIVQGRQFYLTDEVGQDDLNGGTVNTSTINGGAVSSHTLT